VLVGWTISRFVDARRNYRTFSVRRANKHYVATLGISDTDEQVPCRREHRRQPRLQARRRKRPLISRPYTTSLRAKRSSYDKSIVGLLKL
jgi:hypothetical protein